MYCKQCGKLLNEHAKFCTSCGKPRENNHLTVDMSNQLIGYWLCESSNSEAFFEYSQSEICIVTRYMGNGTGIIYYTDSAMITQGIGMLHDSRPFTWSCSETGKLTLNFVNEESGEPTTATALLQIDGSTVTIRYNEGEYATERKLPADFKVKTIEGTTVHNVSPYSNQQTYIPRHYPSPQPGAATSFFDGGTWGFMVAGLGILMCIFWFALPVTVYGGIDWHAKDWIENGNAWAIALYVSTLLMCITIVLFGFIRHRLTASRLTSLLFILLTASLFSIVNSPHGFGSYVWGMLAVNVVAHLLARKAYYHEQGIKSSVIHDLIDELTE